MTTTKVLKKILTKKRRKDEEVISSKDLLSSGSTLLNLALSGRAKGGYVKGKYYSLVGDSDSGKSWLGMSALAEAAYSPEFDDYELIYNNAEDGALMDVGKFFGKLKDRITITASETLDEFYDRITARIEKKQPFIEILDSMDVLDAEADLKKFKKNRSRRDKDTEAKGNYGIAKAKMNSENLRKVRSRLKETGSILIVVSQTRDNIASIGPGDKKTRSGGKAIKFYAAVEFWTSIRENITKKILNKNRQQGIIARIQVKKNHITGKKREVLVPIYHSAGMDDVGSCIAYLVDEGHWKLDKAIKAPEFNFVGRTGDLIKKIQEEDSEGELRGIVQKVWREIETACEVKRKPRYT